MHKEDLVRMANQIASYFTSYPEEHAVAEVVSHIRDFWEPRMRHHLLEHVDGGGHGLHDLVLKGVQELRAPA